MFERFIRLAKAKKALRDRAFEDALTLAADPLIAGDRRAVDIRGTAAAELTQRARHHLEAGDLDAARAEVTRLRGFAPSADVETLAAAVETAGAKDDAAIDHARRTLQEARKALGVGDTATAVALLGSIAPTQLLLERRQLEHLLAERRKKAAAECQAAVAVLQQGNVAMAMESLDRASALDRDCADVRDVQQQVALASAQHLAEAMRDALAAGDPREALERCRAATQRLPALRTVDVVAAARRDLLLALQRQFVTATSIDDVASLAAAVVATDLGDGPVPTLAAAIVHAVNRRGRGDNAAIADPLRAAAAAVSATGLVAAADRLATAGAETDRRMVDIRALLDAGNCDAARAALLELLAAEPLHETARRELELVDRGLQELGGRLEAARAAARAGRLREACTAALALTGSSRVAKEARQLVAEVRSRMAIVDRGLDEVRVSLHGRLAAGIEGVRHLKSRLEELAKVQADHEQLPTMLEAVAAEIAALALCDTIGKAVESHAIDEAHTALLELLPACERLLAKDRLEARLCALADRLRANGDAAVAAARLLEADRHADLLDHLRCVRAEFGTFATTLRAAAQRRRETSDALVAQAKECLARRDLAEAERLVEAAQAEWIESPTARSLAGQLADLRRQADALGRVDAMTKEGDYLGARQKLAGMAPTQPFLRTRIYDMKQNLARAQGLECAFLLRVDEGGEHLVMRSESVSIGNVRQSRADLPILANVAGHHATIRRSMSFHGGMQDTVVAAEGEVRIAGATVAQQALASGDRVQLGPNLSFVYQRPTARSLSAAITLQSGFQVAGTDRILLMKDRGKDGRLLLGPGKDVHVRVPAAVGEVEIFATTTGQIRVRSEVGGTIDGVPFRGEHPIAAGQMVVASGVSFVLLPWRPAA